MNSIIKFGQYVKHIRAKKGMTQLQLSLKVFDKPNLEYIGRLERGTLAGITFTTADKIMLALESEMEFRKFEMFKTDYAIWKFSIKKTAQSYEKSSSYN